MIYIDFLTHFCSRHLVCQIKILPGQHCKVTSNINTNKLYLLFHFPSLKSYFFLFTGRIYFDPTSDFHYCENKQLRLTKKCFKDTQQVFISYFFLMGSLSVCWSRFFRILFSSSRLSSVQFILSNSFQKNSS